ncbi:Regulatory protein RecX [Dissostichus eleginoides]|uniref:Regulatory protein RecX n=1 Tax=Dissostichus eleginoides TaxID=100907 RepID=A0AAD9BRQ1_DISEL|nr:Regulatory protein RecX [Dissostichus eleginoides]
MDPIYWDAIRAIQRNLHPNHQNDINNSIEDAPRTNIEWDTYCEYSRHTVGEAQSSMRVNVEHERLSPSFHNVYIKDSEVQDPDREPLPSDEEDPELSRKRKELREIEERIMFKKAAIALKAVEPTLPNVSSNAATCKGATLKDRVNVILQKRNPARFNSMFWSHRAQMHSPRLSKDSLLQNNHPLKLRVKALMKRICSDPARRECGETPPSPPCRSFTSPAKEETIVNEGFQRFLSVLNKGVDIDLLSRIVNNDDEDLPSGEQLLTTQPPAVEKEPHPSFRSKGQRSNSEASLPGFSQTNRDHDTFCIPGNEENLSTSEGQVASFSRNRCLQVIDMPKAEAEVDPPPLPPKLQENNIEHVSQPEPIHKEKRLPTEEEVKVNLRKTLEAFNQKVKQRVPQPANFPSPHTDYEDVSDHLKLL